MLSVTRRGAPRRRGRRALAGFTMIEMMVATATGAMAIGSVYALGSSSAKTFGEQFRATRTQMGLRIAMAQLRQDLSRAGFLGSPNSSKETTCETPDVAVKAVEFDDDIGTNTAGTDVATTNLLLNKVANQVLSDRVRLVANYATTDAYVASGLSSDGLKIYLQQNWQAYRRSFLDPSGASNGLFDDTFATNRLVHIVTQQGKHYFKRIKSQGTDANPFIEFYTPISVGGSSATCLAGLAEGAMVAPLVRLEYTLAEVSTMDALTGDNPNQLLRREILFTATTPVANSARVVAEFVADFRFHWVLDKQSVGGGAPDIQVYAGAAADTAMDAYPHQARATMVALSLRGDERDPSLTDAAVGVKTYLLDATNGYYTRVRSAHELVYLENLALRGMRQ